MLKSTVSIKHVLVGVGTALTLTLGAACTDDKAATDTKTATDTANKAADTANKAADTAKADTAKAADTANAAAKDPAAEAKALFAARCVLCHGAGGKGDGVGAAGLNPKPRDMTKAEWQKSVTDAHIAKVIIGGGPSVGLSASMPPNPDLADKKPIVDELVKIVRRMQK